MRKSKPKILLILTLPPPVHGANISNNILWHSGIRKTFDCVLLDISDIRDIRNLGRFDLVNVKLGIKSLFDLFRLLKNQRFDLAYILISQNNLGFLRDGLFILLIKLLSRRTRILIHLHGAYLKRFYAHTHWVMKRFVDFTLKRVDAAIVLGHSLKPILEDWVDVVYVVPNGADIRFAVNGPNKQGKRPSNGKVHILFLSNLLRSKGIIDVVKSAVYVSRQCPQAVYKLAGNWGYDFSFDLTPEKLHQDVLKIIASNGLENVVEFTGFVTGKAKNDLLLDADIFVLPSYYEGLPMSIIEAMAAGCPVISTRMGAIPDMILEHETGFFVEPGNPEMLARHIIRLIEDKPLRKRMGLAARRRYEALYTRERFIENMLDVFHRVLGNQNGAEP